MKVSIIIPLIEINDYIRESIPEILKLKENIEIIVLPNEKNTTDVWPKTRIIPSKTSNPSLKRNLGVNQATGEIVAFLDDDAYPKIDWLKQALKHFDSQINKASLETKSELASATANPAKRDVSVKRSFFGDKRVEVKTQIVAVGGPAITPESDSILQKASAAAFESFIGGGGTRNRYLSIGKSREIDDWPSVNLLVRRHVFLKTHGFDPRYWPGEDTKLCLELLKFGQIIYEPKAVVYHHRRGSFIKHLRQTGNYGLHRGHFVRLYPQNSLKLFYLLPSLFAIYLIFGFVLILLDILAISHSLEIRNWKLEISYYFLPLYFYFILMFFDLLIISFRYRNPLVGLAIIPYIFFTHFYYGLRFIKGYFSSDISLSTHSKKIQ